MFSVNEFFFKVISKKQSPQMLVTGEISEVEAYTK